MASDAIVFKNNQLDVGMCNGTQPPVWMARSSAIHSCDRAGSWDVCILALSLILQENTSKRYPCDVPNLAPAKGKTESLSLCLEIQTRIKELVVGSLTGKGRNPFHWGRIHAQSWAHSWKFQEALFPHPRARQICLPFPFTPHAIGKGSLLSF